ncbi:MAG: zinc ribbon domain-containing protein [Methanobacterium sp. ERen5]|nr:MAG: zinc ribbon domain-containing protein [Methanobacterium sp. ERen5]
MSTTRIRKPRTEREYEEIIDELITQGYKIQNRGTASTKLIKASYGSVIAHIIIFVFLGWWTFLVANLIYLAYNYVSNSDEVLVKLTETTDRCPKCQAEILLQDVHCSNCGAKLK